MAHIKVQPFGTLATGQEAYLYTLKNENNMTVSVTDIGAAVQAIVLPGKDGQKRDVVLGFDSAAGYEHTGLYLGATIGRYAGQIRGGSFWLDGRKYHYLKMTMKIPSMGEGAALTSIALPPASKRMTIKLHSTHG